MRPLRILLTIPLLFLTQACSAVSDLITPTPTAIVIPTEEVTPIPALTEAQLKNASYTIDGFDGSSTAYQLVDGVYNANVDPTAPGFVDIRLLDFLHFGDLNEDGLDDAAVLIAADYSGTGVFVTLAAVLNVDGQPRHVASTAIDDRPKINSMKIRNGEILIDAVVHSFEDPGCCPTFEVTRTYKLVGPSLTLVNATSKIPNGSERSILIESPLPGAEASGALVISGRVTIAPFENNLGLRVYNEQGNELTSGPVTVIASDLGAPGSFAVTLDLSTFPLGRIYVEIADFSAADGSVLALATVMVVVR